MSVAGTTYVMPAEYLAQEAQADTKSEYYDGVVIPWPGVSLSHLRIQRNMLGLLHTAVSDDYEVLTSSILIRVAARNSYVYPDVVVVAGEVALDTNEPIAVLLNPLLIVEVLSERTPGYDKRAKFRYYQAIATFREYLLIEQQQVSVTHWWRTEAGEWQQAVYTRLEDAMALQSVPATLALAQVYRRVVFAPVV